MRLRGALAVLLSVLALGGVAFAQPKPHGSGHVYAPPPLDSLGGAFALQDIAGRTVTSNDLLGRWNIVYFGYSRCTDTCPVALPSIVAAAKLLNADRAPARAVFVDIEPPAGVIRPRNPKLAATAVKHHIDGGAAATRLSEMFGRGLLILTGSRSELNRATTLFQVRREHIPARPNEEGHSFNHTSFIYFLSPEGKVAGYIYHDASPAKIAEAVSKLAAGS